MLDSSWNDSKTWSLHIEGIQIGDMLEVLLTAKIPSAWIKVLLFGFFHAPAMQYVKIGSDAASLIGDLPFGHLWFFKASTKNVADLILQVSKVSR